MLPQAAAEQAVSHENHATLAVRAVRKAWRRMRGNWERTWNNDVGPRVVEVVTEAQHTAAAASEVYIAKVLTETGIPDGATGKLNLPAFAGVAGDGRTAASSLYGAVIHAAKAQYDPSMASLTRARAAEQALAEAEAWIEQVTATLVADATRAAEAVAMAQRPWVEGYVRMLDPENPCSRCVVLAGRFYLYNEGFDRHPECRCSHIPARENQHHDVLTNPSDYFHSLTPAQQDKVFTPAGAEAVRLGADISQVVNARRGMHTAQQNLRGWIPKGRLTPVDAFGRKVYVTTEGVTKRGVGRKAMGKDRPFRLMPESILSIARDREDALRLLKRYGYIV